MRRSIARSVAAPWCAIAILLAACTGSGAATEDDQPIEQPAPKPETPAEPDTPDVPDDPDSPDNPDNPDNPGEDVPPYEDVKAVLKEILGDKYEAISGEVSQNITLTAQTIDAVTDIFPDLKAVVEDSSKMNDAKTKVNESTDDVKKALVAQAEGKISVTRKAKQYKVISGKSGNELDPVTGSGYEISAEEGMTVSLEGEFKYFSNHIESLSDNINISGITISSQQDVGDIHYDAILLIPGEDLKEEIYNKLNLEGKNPESLPKLAFGIGGDKELGLKHFLGIYDKYNKSEKLNIDAFFGSIDGRELVDVENYTLFKEDGNTAKDHNDTSIRSFEINKLVKFAEDYHISKFSNLIIYGNAEKANVNWQLTNIIFEGNMSKFTNTSTEALKGIVYFKGLPYNNKDANADGQLVNGAVRLGKLGTTNVKIKLHTDRYSVVDMRDIDEEDILEYNKNENRSIVSYAGSIYFNGNVKKFADDRSLYDKLFNLNKGGSYNNEYFGDTRRDFEDSDGTPASKKPRKLSEFEYYGNHNHFENAAYESYNNDFSSVTTRQKEQLERDKDIKQIAKVTTLCPLC